MLYVSEFIENCVSVRDLSPRTVESYTNSLEDFERTLQIGDPRKISTRDIDHYMSRKFLAGNAPATRGNRLAAVKTFFRFLFTRGYLDDDPAAAVLPPREKRGTIPVFTEEEIEKMIFGCAPRKIEKGAKENDFSFARRRRVAEGKHDRDSAILGLAYSCALRASEIGNIRNADYWVDGNGIPALAITGKGANEPSRMRVDVKVAELIDRWMIRRRGIESDYLFCGLMNAAQEGGVGGRHVREILRARIELAGVKPGKRRLSPHALRYSRATHMYAVTKDIVLVSAFLRHGSVETTIRYIRLGTLSQRAKTATNSLPWNRKGLADLV